MNARWIAALLATTALTTGCSVGFNSSETETEGQSPMTTNDTGAVLWDFRRPLTTLDLGSELNDLASIDESVELEVIFPSGRSLTRTWDWGALANSADGPNFGDGPAQPVDLIALLEGEVDNVADVRASAERFLAEFGPAFEVTNGMALADYLDEFEAIVEANNGTISPTGHGDGDDGLGSTIRAFTAAEQDGIKPGWQVRIVPGGVTLRTSIRFEPAPNP